MKLRITVIEWERAMTTDTPTPPKKLKGFALLSPELRTVMASKGGKAVPPANRTFSKDRGLAMTAGRKGGHKRQGHAKP